MWHELVRREGRAVIAREVQGRSEIAPGIVHDAHMKQTGFGVASRSCDQDICLHVR